MRKWTYRNSHAHALHLLLGTSFYPTSHHKHKEQKPRMNCRPANSLPRIAGSKPCHQPSYVISGGPNTCTTGPTQAFVNPAREDALWVAGQSDLSPFHLNMLRPGSGRDFGTGCSHSRSHDLCEFHALATFLPRDY